MHYIFAVMEQGMEPIRYDVSLRFTHPEMDPEEICKEIEMDTDIKWKAGAPRVLPKGTIPGGVSKHTYCCFRLKSSNEVSLEDFLKRQSSNLAKYKKFMQRFRKTGGVINYFISWWSGGDTGQTFDIELLNQLTELGIELGINVYCIEDEDEDEE
jgi:hypothetical protein